MTSMDKGLLCREQFSVMLIPHHVGTHTRQQLLQSPQLKQRNSTQLKKEGKMAERYMYITRVEGQKTSGSQWSTTSREKTLLLEFLVKRKTLWDEPKQKTAHCTGTKTIDHFPPHVTCMLKFGYYSMDHTCGGEGATSILKYITFYGENLTSMHLRA